MKVTFYKIVKTFKVIDKNNDLFSGVTVTGDACDEETIETYTTLVEAMVDFTMNSDYKSEVVDYGKSYGVKEYAIVEYEVDTDFIDPECGVDVNNCTTKDIVELSSCNSFDTLPGEEVVEYRLFTPMQFVVEIINQGTDETLNFVMFDRFKKANNFANDISLNNKEVYEYYGLGEYDVIAKAYFYDKKKVDFGDVRVWSNVDNYLTAIRSEEETNKVIEEIKDLKIDTHQFEDAVVEKEDGYSIHIHRFRHDGKSDRPNNDGPFVEVTIADPEADYRYVQFHDYDEDPYTNDEILELFENHYKEIFAELEYYDANQDGYINCLGRIGATMVADYDYYDSKDYNDREDLIAYRDYIDELVESLRYAVIGGIFEDREYKFSIYQSHDEVKKDMFERIFDEVKDFYKPWKLNLKLLGAHDDYIYVTAVFTDTREFDDKLVDEFKDEMRKFDNNKERYYYAYQDDCDKDGITVENLTYFEPKDLEETVNSIKNFFLKSFVENHIKEHNGSISIGLYIALKGNKEYEYTCLIEMRDKAIKLIHTAKNMPDIGGAFRSNFEELSQYVFEYERANKKYEEAKRKEENM